MEKKRLVCDCGKPFVPSQKYKDPRVKCTNCIKLTRAAEVKTKCVEYLGGVCMDCGFKGHPVAFDFDHREPEKKSFKISGSYIFRWKELRKELDKCDLRCANCHRIKHYVEDHGH